MCTVYLIHLDRPLAHSSHYLGYTAAEDATARLARHKAGNGAKMLAHANKLGIDYHIVRTWKCENWREARALERRLKKRKNSPKLCPICRGG